MWGELLAATMAAWLHQLTAITAGQDILAGHGVRGGKAMIATLRQQLIAVISRLIRHARHLVLRLQPGHWMLPEVLARLRALQALAELRKMSKSYQVIVHGMLARQAERHEHSEKSAGEREVRKKDKGKKGEKR